MDKINYPRTDWRPEEAQIFKDVKNKGEVDYTITGEDGNPMPAKEILIWTKEDEQIDGVIIKKEVAFSKVLNKFFTRPRIDTPVEPIKIVNLEEA